MRHTTHSTHRPRLAALAAAACLTATAWMPSHAADRSWNCIGTNNFNNGGCWLNGAGPVNGDNAFFVPNLTPANVTVLFPGSVVGTLSLNNVFVNGGQPAAPISLVVDRGTLNTNTTVIGTANAAKLVVGGTANAGGSFSAAVELRLGDLAGSSGLLTVDRSASNVLATKLTVGASGTGRVAQSDGTVTTGNLQIGANGSYELAGGTLNATGDFVNAGTFKVGGSGVLSGAVVNKGSFTVATASTSLSGLTNQSGGTVNINGPLSVFPLTNQGLININGTDGRLLTSNFYNEGTIAISGGTLAVGNFLVNRSTISGYGRVEYLVENRGTLQVDGAMTLQSYTPLINYTTISLNNSSLSSNVAIDNRGTLYGKGTVDAVVQNGGRVTIGNTQVIEFKQGLQNRYGGVVELQGSYGAVLGNGGNGLATIDNAGLLTGGGDIYTKVNNTGLVVAAANADLVFNNDYAASATSVQRAEAGGRLFFYGKAAFDNAAVVGGPYAMFTNRLDAGGVASAGRLTVLGQTWLNRAIYTADILGTRPGFDHDQLVADSLFIIGNSTLRLNSGSFVAQIGQSFDLFDWGSLQGNFSTVDTSGLLLADGAALDLSQLYVDGTVSVTAVPEPAAWALMMGGAALLLARRRSPR